jgi:catechol 2,3-dioxygenase-like lactoylglutathione lyase family enzyme
MVRTRGLSHIALTVNDVERAFRFYERVFGMVAVYREPGLIQAQTPGTWDVLVLEERKTRLWGSGGIVHLGFRLMDPADIEGAIEAVLAAGGKLLRRGEFSPGLPFAYVADPDGYEIEIWFE